MRVAELSGSERAARLLPATDGVPAVETLARHDVPPRALEPIGGLAQGTLVALTLVAADLLAVACTLTAVVAICSLIWPATSLDVAALGIALAAATLVANLAVGLYPGVGLNSISEFRLCSFTAAGIAAVFLFVTLPQRGLATAVPAALASACLLLIAVMPVARMIARRVGCRSAWWGQPALIIGGDESARAIHAFLERHPHLGLRSLGFVCDWNDATHGRPPASWRGPLARAGALARELEGPWLIVCLGEQPTAGVLGVARELRLGWPHRVALSHLAGSSTVWQRVSGCLEWPSHAARVAPPPAWKCLVKRAFDVLAAGAIALVLLPLLVGLAAAIRLTSRGPAIYRQERVGKHGRRFTVWKFRTMVCDGDRVLQEYLDKHPEARIAWERDHKLEHDPRVTAVGRWLRKTSLDELPQLWNVLAGHMSLVGPRPILAREIADFGESFAAFASVPPGMTGLWQVSGRNRTTYAEHIELDRYYARHWSLWLDLYILALTVRVVLFRHGAY